MYRRLLCLFLFFWLITTSVAQAQTTISGRVLDARDQSALIGANVLLVQLPDSTRRGAAVEADGSFTITGVPAGRHLLTVSFLGYQSLRRPVQVGAEPVQLGSLTLQSGSGVALKGVEVVGRAAAAVQKGDTAQFDSRAFKTNPDANAQDLITKMPGVTVDPSTGRVQAQGEQVRRVLVDGKEFFGNDPDAVLRNLPAEAIDKIQVYDRASDQAQFTGFDDGNQQKTINIVTRPQFRNGRFGRVVAGYGPQDDRYRVNGNINSFKGKERISVLAQSNNVNEQNFGTEDLLGVVGASRQGQGGGRQGGGGAQGGRPGGQGQGGASDFLVQPQGGISRTHAAGLNYTNTFGTKTDVQGSYFFNLSDNTTRSEIARLFNLRRSGTDELRYGENSLTLSRNINNRASLRVEHKFDSLNSLVWRPSLSVQRNTATSDLLGSTFRTPLSGEPSTTEGTNQSDYRSSLTGITAANQLLYRHRFLTRGRTFSLGLNTTYNRRKGSNYLLSETAVLEPDSLAFTDVLNQNSRLRQRGWAWQGNATYTEPLSPKSQLQLEYNLGYTPNTSDRRTFDFEPGSQTYSRLNDTLSNVFESYYLTNAGGLTYRYNDQQLQWMVGASVQHARLDNDQTFPRPLATERTFLNVLPNAMLRYNFTKQQNLRAFYRMRTNAPSISQLQEVVNNANPLQLTTGNPNLEQEFQHNLFVRYAAAQPEKSTSFFALLAGSYTDNFITNSTRLVVEPTVIGGVTVPAGGQVTRPVNLNQQYTLRSFLNYSFPLKVVKSNLNLNAGATYSQTPGLVNNALNHNRTPSLSLGVVLSSNISEKLDFTLSSNSAQTYVRNTVQTRANQEFFRQNTSLRLSWILVKGLTVQTDVTHQLNRGLSAGFNQNFVLWNASLGQKVFAKQQGEIRLYAFDILGQNNSIQRNVTAAYTEDVRTNILQRYLMLMFTYNIRSSAAPTPTDDAPRPGGFGPGGPGGPGGFGPGRPGGGM